MFPRDTFHPGDFDFKTGEARRIFMADQKINVQFAAKDDRAPVKTPLIDAEMTELDREIGEQEKQAENDPKETLRKRMRLRKLELIRRPIQNRKIFEERLDLFGHVVARIKNLEQGLPIDPVPDGHEDLEDLSSPDVIPFRPREGSAIQLDTRQKVEQAVNDPDVIRLRQPDRLPSLVTDDLNKMREVKTCLVERLREYFLKELEQGFGKRLNELKAQGGMGADEIRGAEAGYADFVADMRHRLDDEDQNAEKVTYTRIIEDIDRLKKNAEEKLKALGALKPEQERPKESPRIVEAFEKLDRIRGNLAMIRQKRAREMQAKLKEPKQSLIWRLTKAGVRRVGGGVVDLQSEDGIIAQEVEAMARDLNACNALSTNELEQLLREIDAMDRKIGQMAGPLERDPRVDQKRAMIEVVHNLIERLGNKQNKIADVLRDPFFEGHVRYLDADPDPKGTDEKARKGFDALYKNRREGATTDGDMVFNQKPDGDWEIILRNPKKGEAIPINRDALLRQGLTHELRHLEFANIPQSRREEYIRGITTHPGWAGVRQIFMDRIGRDKKSPSAQKDAPPFGNEDWPDEDILDELFAMKDTHGKTEEYKELMDAFAEIGGLRGVFDPEDKNRTAAEILEEIRGERTAGAVADPSAALMEAGDAGDAGAAAQKGGENGGGNMGVESYAALEEILGKNTQGIKDFMASSYLGLVPGLSSLLNSMQTYNEETKQLNAAYKDDPQSRLLAKTVDERANKVAKTLNGVVTTELENAAAFKATGGRNPLLRMWHETYFLSMEDVFQVGKDIYEFMQRRHGRIRSRNAAELGNALFEGTVLGQEAKARREKAEIDEVQEWKSRYENMDAWQMLKEIKNMASSPIPNKDQLKAILRILADKGRIDWFDPHLWKVISRLQNQVNLNPNDETLQRSQELLKKKMHRAMGEIWDYDEFLSLQRKNEDSFNSNKKSYEGELDKQASNMTGVLTEMYMEAVNGGKVDPAKYEAALEYAITKGKSYGEAVLFYLMAGIAEGILPQDRALALDSKHLNLWPATQWIFSKKPPMNQQDFKDACNKNFRDSYKKGEPMGDFSRFYWTVVQNDPMTIQRVRKSVSERVWDHDWARVVAVLGDANTMKRFLSGRSGQQEAKDTGVENAIVGVLQYVEENAREARNTNWRANFTRVLSTFAMMEGIGTNVAYRDTQIYTRYGNIANNLPREHSTTNHPGQLVGAHLDRMRQFTSMIDAQFFSYLRDGKRANTTSGRVALVKDICAHLDANYGNLATRNGFLDPEDKDGIKSLNTIFENMDKIILTMMSGKSDTFLLEKIDTFNSATPALSIEKSVEVADEAA